LKLNPPKLPKILDKPPASGKVLVLAPHADDETIGLGGTILLHVTQGDPVDLLFLTTGITGNADNVYGPEEYIAIRQAEAQSAAQALGARNTMFWDYPDNYRVGEDDMNAIVAKFMKFLDSKDYDIIYTPHKNEVHSDHHVSAIMASRTVELIENPPLLFGYEIWSPLEAEIVVNISSVFDKKLDAAGYYKSQLELSDITRLFKCLNGYRSILLEKKGEYGEALIRMGKKS